MWYSCIQFLWEWTLTECSSKDLISKSERHAQAGFPGDALCTTHFSVPLGTPWVLSTQTALEHTESSAPSSSLRTQWVERESLNSKCGFNRPWTGSELRWNKCPHYLRESCSCPELLGHVNWHQNALHQTLPYITICQANIQGQKEQSKSCLFVTVHIPYFAPGCLYMAGTVFMSNKW